LGKSGFQKFVFFSLFSAFFHFLQKNDEKHEFSGVAKWWYRADTRVFESMVFWG